ncbi:TetR/AcrR family transcriptional regulator [Acidicapsa ligni]|uniref:TetR/AcrR family transcriptional regulator n=1 Tax=Acidicapsa ligni TaxID=542300 RepID=UPI0021DF7E35|nr:TetR/AcrR family transcriptional regulator [Acidicapsa ligni]
MNKVPRKSTQPRTERTHRLLLEAAERVFVRDGYEKAQVAEIAAAASRTKGAVYAHFRDKEDLFLALFEDRMSGFAREIRERIDGVPVEERLDVLRSFYLERVRDKALPLLVLEFKLFAMRHPESKLKFGRTQRLMGAWNFEGNMISALGIRAADDLIGMATSLGSLAPIVSVLALEGEIRPKLFTAHRQALLMERIFDALMVPEIRAVASVDAEEPKSVKLRGNGASPVLDRRKGKELEKRTVNRAKPHASAPKTV